MARVDRHDCRPPPARRRRAGQPVRRARIVDGTNISALYESPSGQMWIATYGRGLLRVDPSGLATLRAPLTPPSVPIQTPPRDRRLT
jgi:hypothetical protein